MIHDKPLSLLTSDSVNRGVWQSGDSCVSAFIGLFQNPKRDEVTLDKYLELPKDEQDARKDVGAYIGGRFKGNRRKACYAISRSLIAFDIEGAAVSAGYLQYLIQRLDSFGFAYLVHSTRKHRESAPRLRVIIFLFRDALPEEYKPLSLKIASLIDPTMTIFDPKSFDIVQPMFWPSCCADSQYVFIYRDRPFLSVDETLALYKDWRNFDEWPELPGVKQSRAAKQADPTAKPGIVGAFCRVYDVPAAMEAFLPGIYEETDQPNRYTFTGGSTTGGALIHDNGSFLFSHHATDPCGGILVNAFDLVRLHKFADLDDAAKPDTPTNKLPSYLAMRDLAVADPAVAPLIAQERRENAAQDFADMGDITAERIIDPFSDKQRYLKKDLGSGYLFADLFVDKLRYCPQARGWYAYNDGRWALDNGDSTARELAKKMPAYMFKFMPPADSGDDVTEFKKQAAGLYTLAARERMLKDAQSVFPVTLEQLDRNADLFNVQNGTLNTRTMQLQRHNPADMASKAAGVSFVPGAACPLWEKTLSEIFEGKPELVRYLQKVLGYALLGEPIEKQFYILYGASTNNGKSTITQTVEKLFGDYAVNSSPETIAQKQFKDSSRPSGDRARLAGVRFVSINEPERGMKLDESYVKAVTGRDTQTARFLHQENFEYQVRFIMLLSTNHLPYISDQTLFKSGRVRVIPIDRSFTESEQDKTLVNRLQRSEELSGILNWVLEGLAAYRREGLAPPLAVTGAVRNYQRESDNVMRFLEEHTVSDLNSVVAVTLLWNAFSYWGGSEGIKAPISLKAFSQALGERGLKIERKRLDGVNPVACIPGLKCTFSNT